MPPSLPPRRSAGVALVPGSRKKQRTVYEVVGRALEEFLDEDDVSGLDFYECDDGQAGRDIFFSHWWSCHAHNYGENDSHNYEQGRHGGRCRCRAVLWKNCPPSFAGKDAHIVDIYADDGGVDCEQIADDIHFRINDTEMDCVIFSIGESAPAEEGESALAGDEWPALAQKPGGSFVGEGRRGFWEWLPLVFGGAGIWVLEEGRHRTQLYPQKEHVCP